MRRRLLEIGLVVLCLAPAVASAQSFGLTYESSWGSYSAQPGSAAVSLGDAAPYDSGGLRLNVVTLNDRTGLLRSLAIAAGSVSEEVSRRESEAEDNGGWFTRGSPGMPRAVAGGDARLSFYWGESESWRHWSIAYTDGLEPTPIADTRFFYTIEARVRLGLMQHTKWVDEFSMYVSLLQVGPVIGYAAPRLGPVQPVLTAGARIDPLFKPLMRLAVGYGNWIDMTAYSRVQLFMFRNVMLSGEVSYSRGYMSYGSDGVAAGVQLGAFL